MRIRKDTLYPGVWYPSCGRVEYTPAYVRQVLNNTMAMVKAGRTVPVLVEHQPIGPLTMEERVKFAKDTLGHVASMSLGPSGELIADLELPDSEGVRLAKRIGFVSPQIRARVVDGKGRTWTGPIIAHVALTPTPVQVGQKKFGVNLSMSGGIPDVVELSMDMYRGRRRGKRGREMSDALKIKAADILQMRARTKTEPTNAEKEILKEWASLPYPVNLAEKEDKGDDEYEPDEEEMESMKQESPDNEDDYVLALDDDGEADKMMQAYESKNAKKDREADIPQRESEGSASQKLLKDFMEHAGMAFPEDVKTLSAAVKHFNIIRLHEKSKGEVATPKPVTSEYPSGSGVGMPPPGAISMSEGKRDLADVRREQIIAHIDDLLTQTVNPKLMARLQQLRSQAETVSMSEPAEAFNNTPVVVALGELAGVIGAMPLAVNRMAKPPELWTAEEKSRHLEQMAAEEAERRNRANRAAK